MKSISNRRNRFAFIAASALAFAAILATLILGSSSASAQGRGGGGGRGTTTDKIDNGKKLFSSQKCDGCHGAQGQGGTSAVKGPQIAGSAMDLSTFTGHVRNPKDPMPAYSAGQVSDADLSDIYTFLKTAGPNQPTLPASASSDNGKKLFVAAGCYECHSREGQGGSAGPRIAPNPISLAAFMNQCRQPADQMPPYTSKVLSDAQLADIYAFLLSVPKPPDPSTISILQ